MAFSRRWFFVGSERFLIARLLESGYQRRDHYRLSGSRIQEPRCSVSRRAKEIHSLAAGLTANMRRFIRKHRKRILFAAAAVVFFPTLLFLLLWWDSRPKKSPDVTVDFVKVVSRGQSNWVTAVLSNRSNFPVACFAFAETNHPVYSWVVAGPTDVALSAPRGLIAAQSNLEVAIPFDPPTNRWRVTVSITEAHASVLERPRRWLEWYAMGKDGLWRFSRMAFVNKAHGFASSQEMVGESPALQTK
jgi:hypothetical protein